MPGRMEFQFTLPKSSIGTVRRDANRPPRILVMADFSGRGRREPPAEAAELANRPLLEVEIGRLDAVMARLRPELRLTLGGAEHTVFFQQLDDFHPDALYRRLDGFQALRHARARLLDPAQFAQAAAELALPVAAPSVQSEPAPPAESEPALFERLLGRAPTVPTAPAPASGSATDALQHWLRAIVQPHVVHTDPRQASWVAAVDAAIGDQLRALLHQPAFQALEATWRGLRDLVADLDDPGARVFLLDVTREELLLDLRAAGGRPSATHLRLLLIERGVRMPDGESWTLLIGDYAFGAEPEDIALLAALGALASEAGGPFVAAARPELAGCATAAALADRARWSPLTADAEARWQALRGCEVAPWLGLALPRVLLRLPYGRKTEPIETLPFEEMPGGRDPAAYLWGNPAFACARLIAAAFAENGWDFNPGDVLELEGGPAHVVEEAGERVLQPLTEVLLGEQAMQALLARGLMPLLGHRQRNAARLARFQSLADPPKALAGAWRS